MANVVVAQRMWQRRGSAALWASRNPVLEAGEIGVELGETSADPQKFKIGNGATPWNDLAYFSGGGGGAIEMQVSGGYIQYRNVGDPDWENVIAVAELQGPPGAPGGPGDDGREVDLRATATHVQWRYVGDVSWVDLIAVADLAGPPGDPGEPGPAGGPSVVRTVSGASYTLDGASDRGAWLEHQGGAVRVPETAAGGFTKDDVVEVIQSTATPVTFIADTPNVNVDFNTALFSAATRYRGGAVVLKCLGTNSWRLLGALADA